VRAIEAGYPQREIAEAAYRFQREVDERERRIVGVNSYVDQREVTTVPVLEVPQGSLENHMARLARTRRERDAFALWNFSLREPEAISSVVIEFSGDRIIKIVFRVGRWARLREPRRFVG